MHTGCTGHAEARASRPVDPAGTGADPSALSRGQQRSLPMRKPAFLLPLLALITLAACETVEGAGRDIGAAGDAITQESQEAQTGM